MSLPHQWLVYSMERDQPTEYTISLPMSRAEADRLADDMKNHGLDADVVRYTNQEAGQRSINQFPQEILERRRKSRSSSA